MRKYGFARPISGVTGAQTLAMLTAPADMVVRIDKIVVTGDQSTAEQLDIAVHRVTTVGSFAASEVSGVAFTIQKFEDGDAASTVTAKVDATTEPDAVGDDLVRERVQNMAGFYYEPPQQNPLVISPSASLAVKIMSAPSNSHGLTVAIEFTEIGG